MGRSIVFTVILGCVLAGTLAAQQADITKVIPEKALVAFISRNPQALEDHIGQIAGKLGDDAPPKGFMLDELLSEIHLHRRRAVEGPDGTRTEVVLPTCIDRTKPMALVVVAPGLEPGGKPVGMVVNVSDYRKLLKEVAEIAGAPGPEVTPEGTDVIKGVGRSTYALRMGDYAVMADAEFVIKAFKAGANKNLAGGSVAALKNAYEKGDLAVYVNLDEVLRAFAFQINAVKMMFNQQMMQNPQPNAPFPPEKMAKIINAYIDTGVKLGREIDAITASVKLGEQGVTASCFFQANPDTSVARIAAGLRPAPLDLLNTGDGPFMAVAAFNVQQAAVDEATKVAIDFLKQMELFGDAAENEKALALITKMATAATGRGALFLAPPEAGKPLVRGISVTDLKPGSDIRETQREYAKLSTGIFKNLNKTGMKIEMGMQTDVETHRGVGIDRMTIAFDFNIPDAPQAQAAMAGKMIDALYGKPMVVHYAIVKDKMIEAIGDPTSTTVKAWIDRVLDGKRGNVTQDPTFVSALKGLPEGRAGVLVIGAADSVKGVIGTGIFGDEAVAKAVAAIQFEKPSGIGLTVGPAQKGCALHLNVPMQEMLNIKQIVMTVMQVMMQKMFQP